MNDLFDSGIRILLGLSSVLFIVEAIGFMPPMISRWINRNRLAQTIQVLAELGVNVDETKKALFLHRIPEYYNGTNLEKELREELAKATINSKVGVGKTDTVKSDLYIDVMGYSTKPECAELYARYLSSYLRNSRENIIFDFIVTPKSGSPLIGYELAKLLGKPLALYNDERKFDGSDKNNFIKHFDYNGKAPNKGSIALLVDDSTTGGRKILNAAMKLKSCGYNVEHCLVLFEPTIKDPRTVLKNGGVTLYSITKY